MTERRLLELAYQELERLHDIHFEKYQGKIGEPDLKLIKRIRKYLHETPQRRNQLGPDD